MKELAEKVTEIVVGGLKPLPSIFKKFFALKKTDFCPHCRNVESVI